MKLNPNRKSVRRKDPLLKSLHEFYIETTILQKIYYEEKPMTFEQLQKELDFPKNVLNNHLNSLVQDELLIQKSEEGGRTKYLPPPELLVAHKNALKILKESLREPN